VCAAAGLELGQEMAYVGLDRLLGEVERLPDLTVHETVGDELEHLRLALSRLLLEPPGRGPERNDLAHGRLANLPAPLRRRLVETTGVIQVPSKDLLSLCCIHNPYIGGGTPFG
jgi:hypothetical protein